MDDKLYTYLKEQWKRKNHKKYQKYFESWVENLTSNQLYYFRKLWLNKSVNTDKPVINP